MGTEILTKEENALEKSNGQHSEGALARLESARCWASAPTDVFESPDDYLVLANIPGVSKEDVDVQYADGQLRIEARRPADTYEPRAIDYRRTFELGRDVNIDGITAELKNGLLEVHMPKLESAKPKQILIQASW